MIKRIIFDVDGTLIRNVNFTSAVANTLQRFNLNTKENTELMIHAMMTYGEVYNNYNRETYIKHIEKYLKTRLHKDFLRVYFNELKIVVNFEDKEMLKEKLEELSKKYELVLLSNYFEESQRNRLKTLGINDFFKEYYGERISKSDIRAFIDAIRSKSIDECLMIGDSLKCDIYPAIKMGMPVLHIGKSEFININDISGITEEKIEESVKTLRLNY